MIKIKNHTIIKNGNPFIIAEVGINHNGEIEKALKMIKIAKESGADAVKFQTFKAEEFVGDKSQMFTYNSQGKTITESMLEMFKRYEFCENEWVQIKNFCDKENIIFISTPQNVSDLNLLIRIGIPAIKIGSDDFTNLPLLRTYASKKLPIFLSCGMADLGEIYNSLEIVDAFNGAPIVLLLCTSQYPTPPHDVNLLKLKTLAAAFPNLILGFSDHTQGPLASSIAVAFGAVVFEKHFTLDNNLPGPDHWFAENPENLKKWVNSIRTAYQMLGSSIVRPTEGELKNKKEFRRYIVAAKSIKKGEIFSDENIIMKRLADGNGLTPSFYDFLIGKVSHINYKKGEAINL